MGNLRKFVVNSFSKNSLDIAQVVEVGKECCCSVLEQELWVQLFKRMWMADISNLVSDSSSQSTIVLINESF